MSIYINTETLAYPVFEYDIKQEYPNTSFPDPFVPPSIFAVVNDTPLPPYNKISQTVVEEPPAETDGQWYKVWLVVDLDPAQVAINEARAKSANKMNAEALLQQTDWTATVDINNPVYSNPYLGNQPEFLTYRSAVRQIALNPPVEVSQWPVMPEEIWVPVTA